MSEGLRGGTCRRDDGTASWVTRWAAGFRDEAAVATATAAQNESDNLQSTVPRRMQALVVAPYFPYPPTQGGVYDMWNRLRALTTLPLTVDLVATVKPGERPDADAVAQVEKRCRHITLLERRNRPLDMLSLLPLQCKSRLRSPLDLDLTRYAIVLWENHYTLGLFLRHHPAFPSDARHFLRIQNDERRYFLALARAERGLRSLYYLAEALRFRALERRTLHRFEALLHISSAEVEDYRSAFPSARHHLLPAALDLSRMRRPTARGGHTVLFCGSLFMPNNIDALRWYLLEVHPILTRRFPAYRFVVAGNTKGTMPAWLQQRAAEQPNVEVHDSPSDLSTFYARASVFVNPMREGTGVKLKTLDALLHGLPVVSTSVGAEGTTLSAGDHLLVADEPGEFAGAVARLLEDATRGTWLVGAAQEWMRRTYDTAPHLQRILDLDTVGPRDAPTAAASGRAPV